MLTELMRYYTRKAAPVHQQHGSGPLHGPILVATLEAAVVLEDLYRVGQPRGLDVDNYFWVAVPSSNRV